MRAFVCLAFVLISTSAFASPPTFTTDALGIGATVTDDIDGAAVIRYRRTRMRPLRSLYSLTAAASTDPTFDRLTAELGAGIGHWLPILQATSLTLDALAIRDDGATAAIAPGISLTPFAMTDDKWGDLDLRARRVIHLSDRDDHPDRWELSLTLYFNLRH